MGAYACTIVMVKGTSLRRMVMSLLGTVISHDNVQDVRVNKKSNVMLVCIIKDPRKRHHHGHLEHKDT